MKWSPTRRQCLSALGATLGTTLAGCSTLLDSSVLWSKSFNWGPGIIHIDDGTVYGSQEKEIFALDASDGSERWLYEDDDWTPRSRRDNCYDTDVVGDETHVYVASCNGITAFDKPTGEIQWAAGPELSRLRMTYTDGRIYGGDEVLVAFDPETRTTEWEREPEEESFEFVTPTVTDELVVATAGTLNRHASEDQSGSVTAYDLEWTEYFTQDFDGRPRQPAVDDRHIYLPIETEGEAAGKVLALSREDGSLEWDVDIPLPTPRMPPVLHRDRVYVPTDDIQSDLDEKESHLLAYDRDDGTEVMRFTVEETAVEGPSFLDDTIVASAGSTLYGLSLDGEEQWSFTPRERGRNSRPFVSDGIVYVNAGNFYAFDPDG